VKYARPTCVTSVLHMKMKQVGITGSVIAIPAGLRDSCSGKKLNFSQQR
jgi:hypothetical protein